MLPHSEHVAAADQSHEMPPPSPPAPPPTSASSLSLSPCSSSQPAAPVHSIPTTTISQPHSVPSSASIPATASSSASTSASDLHPSSTLSSPPAEPAQRLSAPPAAHPTVASIVFPSGPSTSHETLLPSAPGSSTSSRRQSRSSSPAPAPILRTISHGVHTNKAWHPSATANVNAQGSAISTLTSLERQQITDSLRAHKRSSSLATLKSFASASTPSLIAKPPSQRRASPAPPSEAASAEMPAPTHPPYRRSQKQTVKLSRTQSATPPHTRASDPADATHHVSTEESEKERQRLKAAAAAKLAEEEAWEKTRGAGSAVLDLLKLPDISDDEADQDRSGESSGGRQSRATTPGSASGSNSGLSAGGSANSNNNSQASSSASSHIRGSHKAAKSKSERLCKAARVLPSLEDVQSRRNEPVVVSSADKLLSRGISEYTLLPKILGRGKFSSVFLASKPHGPTGEPQLFAIKHTPLFPHHPLIATRLLREPTLLAELPPHPNLVNVYETIRTPGHFYLVEEYLNGYVTLEALLTLRSEQSPPHLPILPTGVANCVLDQLLSAVHAIHHPLQICHRDIKPENILVHPDTLQLKLLDFGLATHFSRSEAKLSTCCGSPAFHCPEIVTALRNPMGTVHYWGPEVDAWTCGITMLRLLTGIRYPIGPSHTSVRSMAIRAQRAVATIKDPELRDRVGKLLEVNGERRMRNFEELVKQLEASTEEPERGVKEFKSTTFIPVEPQHKMNLPLVVGPAAEAALISPLLPSGATPTGSKRSTPMNSRPASPVLGGDVSDAHLSPAPTLLLSNPTYQPAQRVLSYVKYCLRCAGILYHCWPDTSSSSSLPSTPGPFEAAFQEFNQGRNGDLSASTHQEGNVPASLSPSTPFPIQAARSERDPYSHIHVFECVLEIVDPPPGSDQDEPQGLVQSIFSALSFGRRPANRRSLSTPPKPENLQTAGTPRPPGTPADAPVSGSGSTSGKAGDVKCLTFYIVLRFPRRPSGHVNFVRPSYSRSSSAAGHSRRTRSRASSAAGTDSERGGLHRDASTESLTRLSKLHSANAEFATGIHPLRKAMIDSNHTTPRASRTSSPSVNYGNLKKREGSLARHREYDRQRQGHKDTENNVGLTIETSPELLRIAENQASRQNSPSPQSSAPNSRATSRARSSKSGRPRGTSASHRNGGSNKVFVHVTDNRALDAVRKALSIGGTTTDYNPDIEPDHDDAGGMWASPDLRAKDMALGEDSDPGFSLNGAAVKLRRPHSKRRHHSHRQASGLATAVSEDEGISRTGDGKRPWTDVPAGSMKPRSTISFGGDDQEQYTRGRPLGPASSLSSQASGIPVPGGTPRLRASSNLAFAVVHEESSPSNTEHSMSESKTMIDLQDKPTGASQAAVAAEASADQSSADFDLTQAVATVNGLTAELLQESSHIDRVGLESKVSEIAAHLFDLQTKDAAKMTQELDALSFDLFKALSPLAGVVERSSGSRTQLALKAKQIVDLLGEYASSREIYMAADMRCGELLDPATIRYTAVTEDKIYTSASETVNLMRLVNTVLPRIRTKKPQGFSQVFVRLPQCLSLSLAALPEEARASKEMLAKGALQACCSTALIVVDWEAKCLGVEEREPVRKTSKEALERFIEGVTVCLPHLSGAQVALSEEYFLTQSPRYELGSSKESSSVKRNKSLFAEISKTLASLEVDLGSVWSKALVGVSRAPEDDSTGESLTALSVAAFILDVHLRYSGYARDKPSEWKGVKARLALESALPMLLLALREQMKAAADPEMEPGREDGLADASLVWMQWCMHGLQGEVLPDEFAVSVAQMLASQSVISPSAGARLIRFKMLTEVVTRRCEKRVAVGLIEQMIVGSPFAQVRAAGVSILRGALDVWLSSEADDEAGMADVAELVDKVFVPPTDLPNLTVEQIAEEAGKLTECLNLLYWIEAQMRSGRAVKLGEVESRLAKWKAAFADPLAEKLDQMKQARSEQDDSQDWQQVELLTVAVQRVATPKHSDSNPN